MRLAWLLVPAVLALSLLAWLGSWEGSSAPGDCTEPGGCAPRGPAYRFSEFDTTAANSNRNFVVLVLSGGGTRAASLAYGVVRELERTRFTDADGRQRSLLDEVDVITSVSGGSFIAAYLALNGADSLAAFERDFLRWDAQAALSKRAAAPRSWRRLFAGEYGRSDLAAEVWDEQLFHGKTYADLVGRRPYLLVNATDMGQGSQFTFTQEYFDPLCRDLADFPLARAVAASSAFPGMLTPMTLRSAAGRCGYRLPLWAEDAIDGVPDSLPTADFPLLRSTARHLAGYDNVNREYVHLVDGGLSDNLGGRVAYRALVGETDFSVLRVLAARPGEAHRVAVIVVDARPHHPPAFDGSPNLPGLGQVLAASVAVPMTRYSDDTLFRLEERLLLLDGGGTEHFVGSRDSRFYFARVAVEDMPDSAQRHALERAPTSLSLPGPTVDRLIDAGGLLLRNSQGFRRLVGDLPPAR